MVEEIKECMYELLVHYIFFIKKILCEEEEEVEEEEHSEEEEIAHASLLDVADDILRVR